MSSDFQNLIRHLRPHKQLTCPQPRSKSDLGFLDRVTSLPKLLYDTTVYIDLLQDTFPKRLDPLLQAADAWHSSVTEAELVAGCGMLAPNHPQTATVVAKVSETLDSRREHRILVPDREIWVAAGMLSAILARLQHRSRAERILLLNDCLILETARKHGVTVLTRNVRDFDLLQQLEPTARVLFYERTA